MRLYKVCIYIPELIFKHYPDPQKPRSFNLPLLQLAVSENPSSTRNIHYLGREYYFVASGKTVSWIQTRPIY